MIDMPYFMTNQNWYYYDFEEKKYKIHENVSEEVKKSYEEYMKELE